MKALYQAQKEEDDERDAQRRMRLRQQRQALDKELFAAQRHLAEETKVGYTACFKGQNYHCCS